MEKTQADAIINAILEPNLRAQEELGRKRAAGAAKLARQRRVAWFALAGSAIGVVVTHFAGFRFSEGIICGGLTGALIGTLVAPRAAQ